MNFNNIFIYLLILRNWNSFLEQIKYTQIMQKVGKKFQHTSFERALTALIVWGQKKIRFAKPGNRKFYLDDRHFHF